MDNKTALRSRLANLSPEQRAALLQQISQMREQQGAKSDSPPQTAAPADPRYPLSLAQRRLWMLSQMSREASAAYNIVSAFYFDKTLEPQRLQQAWRLLLARHEVLRSAFVQESDTVWQWPRDAQDWVMQQHTLKSGADFETQLVQLATEQAAQPFDLQHDWLLKVIYCAAESNGPSGLVVVIHHSVCDGLSIAAMVRELAQYYAQAQTQESCKSDQANTTVPQYRDYVDFEARADTGKAKAYWKNVFGSAPETLDALLDLPRPVTRDFAGSSVTLTLDKTETEVFETFCHAHKATLYMGLVALVQLLLARFANVGEVTLGTPVAGRPGAQFDKVVGPFVNTVALRQRVDRQQTFTQLLQQVRRCVLEGFSHQGLAFDELVTELGFAKDPARSPLYDVMLGLTSADEMTLAFNTGASDNNTSNISAGRALRIPLLFSKVDLTFHFEKDSDGSLRLELEYASSLLTADTARRLCDAWRLLAVNVPHHPERPVSAFALQSDHDQRMLLEQINATTRPYPHNSTLIAEFRKTAQRYPDAIAVYAGDVKLSYQQLDQLSDQLAYVLMQHPAHSAGCHIALMLEKDQRALIVIVAILKSGAVYVPLAANTPPERVAEVLVTGDVSLLLAETNRVGELQQLILQHHDLQQSGIVVLDADAQLVPGAVNTTALLPPEATDGITGAVPAAYLMFTSGSTGKPKGTLIDQRSVLRLVCNTDYHQVQAGERVLLTGSLAFDAATFEIWGPLLNGGCVCIPAGTTLLEVHEFQSLVEHYQVDTTFLTTGLFNQLVDNNAPAFARLQTVLTGGEKISVGHVRKLLSAQPALKLLHVYGPTENTTFSTWHHIKHHDLALSTIPIGRPIANSRIYLLDENLQPVPVGVPGEIYCGGDGIARGYIFQRDDVRKNQSDVFLPDPFMPAGTGRLYRTGDLAKWNHKHELVFVGRNDRQVKIRGFRVELAEVEYHLRSLPGVTDAFVQARGDAGSSELIAWLVMPAGSDQMAVGDVRDGLKGRVPNYMLPAKIVCLERLPLNASGKVDVKALPLPEDSAGDSASAAATSGLHGKAEQDMARLYAAVLGLTGSAAQAIDRDCNFFSLGGDSIRAIQLVSLARSESYHFALKDIFASETLAGLAATATVTAITTAEAALSTGPLSPTQLWWLEQCGEPADHFNLSSVFCVDGSVDTEILRTALDELMVLHPALRLTLDLSAQQQAIRDHGRYELLQVTAGQSRQQCWQALQQAINLQSGVLLAVGVAAEADKTWLAVVVHHLAADEVSGRLFTENLVRLYQRHLARSDSSAATLTPPPVPEALGLINWAAQLKAAVERGALDHDLAYWQDVVARGRQALQRHTVFAGANARRSTAVQTLPQADTQSLLRNAAVLLRMTPQEILLAAFIRAWQQTLNQTHCLLSLEGHGREAVDGVGDCSSTMGWFTSLYPFVYSSTEQKQTLDLYREIKDNIRRLPNKGFSYLPLRFYKSEAERTALSLKPQLSFNYLGESANDAQSWLSAAPETAGNDHGEHITQAFKLDVLARINAGQFELSLRGRAPNESVGLMELAAAWLSELEALAARLQDLATALTDQSAIHSETHGATARPALLSLSDSLVPFASLAELDATLDALRLPALRIEEIWPLTAMQAGMYLHCASHPSAYQDQVALRLQQPLDESRFAAAVGALVAETQALRTGFTQTPDGHLLQIVFAGRTGCYQYIDAEQSGVQHESDLALLRTRLRSRQRDLLREPLFHLTLVRIHASCFELIIDFHHMALDGWTSALLLQRLEALYFGDAASAHNSAAGGMRRYFEWFARQAPEQARDYWQQLLGDYYGRSDVPAHLPRRPATEHAPLFVETRTGAALHASLLSWCEQHGLTINAVVQSLWGVFLGRLTGSDDLVFGATVSGRDIDLAGVNTIAGMLINTLPVRIRAREADSFAQLVRTTAQQFAESMSFGHLSLADIQTMTPARGGLVTHALVFENYPASDAAARWQWQPQDIFDPMHFEFGVIVAPLSDDLSFRFVADGSLYLRDKLQQMGAGLCTLLAALLDTQQAVAQLPSDMQPSDIQPFGKLLRGKPAGWSLSANFTADTLPGLLQHHEYISGNSAAVTLLPYDQSVQELMNPDSRLRRLQPQQHIVLWRPPCDDTGAVIASAAAEQLAEIATAAAGFARASANTQLVFVPCPWLDPQHQDCDWTLYREFAAFTKGALAGLSNTQVLNLETLATTYALQQSCYPPALIFGDIPYTEEFFAALANQLVRQRDLQLRAPVKVYVVDADDTLWGGIVGEDGVHGIRLDAVHMRLQQQLVNARAAGALICLATKNNEDDVRVVFEQREMPLRWTHLTRVCAGWKPKSDSIHALADELSLGLDSFVFIDDSPLECEQVLAECPGVRVIQLPSAQQREAFLAHLWLLDARSATREDAARAQMYAEELQRSTIRKSAGSYAEFLMSLDIRVDLRAVQLADVARVAQLTQRTNQFNTSGVRYTEADIASLLQQADMDIRCISVTDKYGDYGLTGCVFIKLAADAWRVSGLMLSCRVLGRGVEHTILRQLAEQAAASDVAELRVDFVKLPRNAPALQFLQSIDAVCEPVSAGNQQFCLSVAAARHWQPGGDTTTAGDSALPPETGVTTNMTSGPIQIDSSADAKQLSERLSRYYQMLAGTLNSGAAILHDMQQGVVQNTGKATRHTTSRTPPQTATELMLASVFAELLAQTDVFREDSFYDLGGHSLKAVMLFSRIAARCGVSLDFRDLQLHPTVAALAARVDEAVALLNPAQQSVAVLPVPVLHPRPSAQHYAVSPGQSRLWMLEQLRAAGPSPFHMHATLTVAAGINRQALDLAFDALLARHEALRTCFRELEAADDQKQADITGQSRLRQFVLPMSSLRAAAHNSNTPVNRVHWIDDPVDHAELTAIAQQHSAQAFDLGKAPLVRMAAGNLVTGGSVLFITLHHIISDGWSMGIFSAELSRLYDEFNVGKAGAARPDITTSEVVSAQLHLSASEHNITMDTLQFRDFAAWQIEWLASAAGARAREFWREHFAQPVEALQLPAAAPRPAVKQNTGASVQIDIDAALWTDFRRRLLLLGISDFSGLFAALQVVLARLSGQQDFCVGTVVAGRPHEQLESVIGFFVNVLPLRTSLTRLAVNKQNPEQTDHNVDAFMQAVAAEVNDCLSHQNVPFDTIVSGLNLVRDPGRTPLFDVLLVLQNTGIDPLRLGVGEVDEVAEVAEVVQVPSTTSQYDLTLSAFPSADGSLTLLAEYDSAIYSSANIELILRCLVRTVSALTETRAQSLANLAWLDERDIARVKSFEGELPAPLSHDGLSSQVQPSHVQPSHVQPSHVQPSHVQPSQALPDFVRRIAADAPGRICDDNTNWSYHDLMHETQRIASLLQNSGLTVPSVRQTHVGVIGRRSVRSVAAMLGVMDAGAVYIPLDLSNPAERLQMIVQEGAVDVLLSTDEEGAVVADGLAQHTTTQGHLCYSDPVARTTPPQSTPAAPFFAEPAAVAYMIFTSGSTGKPKGVQISHAAFTAMITQQIKAFDVRSTDVCAQFAALSFDASLSEIFLALGTGASLVITPEAARSDIDTFMRWLHDRAITVITLPPVFLRALDQQPLGALRVLITAGEAAIADDLRHYATTMSGSIPNARVVNAYGPTETSVCASVYQVDTRDTWPFGVPIGKPLPGVVLTVRDNTGARVPTGVTGELYIGGATVGEGYYAAAGLTQQKFVVMPDDVRRTRWYRSGDLVRWRDDGQLEYLGRADTQIKLRGYRIEPGEIEQAARQLDGVDDALVLVHSQRGLLLYCVTQQPLSQHEVLRAAILVELAGTLPRYMLPAVVCLLDTFPLSPAGKIDRHQLLSLFDAGADSASAETQSSFVAPATDAERVLAQAWCRVLNRTQVGRHDDFFALGGDSIKALEVLRVIRSLAYNAELKDFFAAPLLLDMAKLMTPWRESGRFRMPLAGPVALLPVQNWFLRSRDPVTASHFHIVVELAVPASVTVSILQAALAVLVQDHDSLRARFYQHNSTQGERANPQWTQEIQTSVDINSVFSCYQRSAELATSEDQNAVEALACAPFVLESGPLFRCVLMQRPDGDSEALVLTLHHLIADWVSLRILIADLDQLIRGLLSKGLMSKELISKDSEPEHHQPPPHLLHEVAQARCAEQASAPPSWSDTHNKAVATMTALALGCGDHSALQTLHIHISADELAALRAFLRQQSLAQKTDFSLQDLLLSLALSELGDLLPVRQIPLLVESHGRDGALDLARQVAWLTRARLFNVDISLFSGPDALVHAHNLLAADAALQPDVFACAAANSTLPNALPALISFNYLGEFNNSQHPDDLLRLTGRVFNKAMAETAPVDVPLHLEFYVVDSALEIQVAWTPEVFESAAMRACWLKVKQLVESAAVA